ncbi:hypothetical protein SAM40697_5828 [Streptomyces ambofaciens]|uniref:Uncharacterized protein n=1 Tax=Streptomyces ambofaciens TaxID=1889 RepID=A0ABM6B7H6_STRAM|nr:hypothetical protein SAM40697_5828 [Streptomyces ambofaciens]
MVGLCSAPKASVYVTERMPVVRYPWAVRFSSYVSCDAGAAAVATASRTASGGRSGLSRSTASRRSG